MDIRSSGCTTQPDDPVGVVCGKSPTLGIRRSCYRGVRMRSWGKWVSEIREPRKRSRIWLGSYFTPEAAARAYDTALLCLRGPAASFNFPDSLPQPEVQYLSSPRSVQKAALAAGMAVDALYNRTKTDTSTAAHSEMCSLSTSSSSVLSTANGMYLSFVDPLTQAPHQAKKVFTQYQKTLTAVRVHKTKQQHIRENQVSEQIMAATARK
eukprot:c47232_g1_i1 orf=859-1485(-)